MGLFQKKKEKIGCKEYGNCQTTSKNHCKDVSGASVKVLGGGCDKCRQLEVNALEALKQLGMETTIEHVTDFGVIAGYGVMTTPALVYQGNVVSSGRVLSVSDIVQLLQRGAEN